MRVKIMAKEGSKQTVYGKPIQKKGIPIQRCLYNSLQSCLVFLFLQQVLNGFDAFFGGLFSRVGGFGAVGFRSIGF